MRGCSTDSVLLPRAQRLVYLVDVRTLKKLLTVYIKIRMCASTLTLYWMGTHISGKSVIPQYFRLIIMKDS